MKEVKSMSQFSFIEAYQLSTLVYFDCKHYKPNMSFIDYIDGLIEDSYQEYFYQQMQLFAKQLDTSRWNNYQVSACFNDNLKTGLVYYVFENEDSIIIVLRGSENYDAYSGQRGWEDWLDNFDIFFKITDQQLLVLNQIRQFSNDKKLYLCGHSKGGNLALFLACCAEEALFERIEKVIAINAPGLNDDMCDLYRSRIESEAFQQKVACYVNEHDCISALFNSVKKPVVLASKYMNKTLLDVYANHQLYAFKISDDEIEIKDEISILPALIHKYIYQGFIQLPKERRMKIIEECKSVLNQTGSLEEILHVIAFMLGEKLNILDEEDLQWVKEITIKSLVERIQKEVSGKITLAANKILQRIHFDFTEIGEEDEKA